MVLPDTATASPSIQLELFTNQNILMIKSIQPQSFKEITTAYNATLKMDPSKASHQNLNQTKKLLRETFKLMFKMDLEYKSAKTLRMLVNGTMIRIMEQEN